MNPPGENDKLPDELDHAFTSLRTLVNLTKEVASYLTKTPLPPDKPQPDRAQKFVELFDLQRDCERLYRDLRDQCEHASRNTLIGGGHKSYFDVVLFQCGRFLFSFHSLVESAVSETIRVWSNRRRALHEELDHQFNTSGRDPHFQRRMQKVDALKCPISLGSWTNGPQLAGRPKLDIVASHFAIALKSKGNVAPVQLPQFSESLMGDLHSELRRVAQPPFDAAPAALSRPRGFFGGTELVDVLEVFSEKREAFFTALSRTRKALPEDSWLEVANKRPNAPEFLYRADCEEIQALAKKYQADT